MTTSISDIFNNIIKYNSIDIIVVFDKYAEPWFMVSDIVDILGYEDTRKVLKRLVPKTHYKPFNKIKTSDIINIKNFQTQSLFVDEPGLYLLLLNSKKNSAKHFKIWISEEVMPSIRKYGKYKFSISQKQKLDIINKKIAKLRKENRTFKNNQNKFKVKKRGALYIISPINDNKKKMGFTFDPDGRFSNYNTAHPDRIKLHYLVYSDHPKELEKCVKSLLTKYQYRKNKEYYECSLKKIKHAINDCTKMIKKYDNDSQQNRIMDNLNENTNENKKNIYQIIVFDKDNQIGGEDENIYYDNYEYTKYKYNKELYTYLKNSIS
jgi:prophage antirepressor-like protein